MNRLVAFILVNLACLAIARAGKVEVIITMTTGLGEEETTTFAPDTPKIYATFKTIGAKNGDKARAVLIADDVGDVAPPETKVVETSLTLEGDTDDGDFNFSKPTNGWPPGKYHVEVYVNNELAAKAKFTVKASAKSKKDSDEDESSQE
jgi:hypothetical protein